MSFYIFFSITERVERATAPRRRLFAGTTHMAPVHHVTESLEGAVVFAPTVLYSRMAETHVVVE